MNNPRTVVVLGKFDGVHIAHAKLITTAVDIASQREAVSLVYSMYKTDTPVMTDNNQKIDIIKSLGADRVVFKELDEEFMMLSAEEFVENILQKELNACCLVVGENFRFGKNRSAGAAELKELGEKSGIDVVVIDTLHIDSEPVSSTYVKKLLSEGNVSVACEYLGRPFSMTGTVSEGKHLGRTLGFPTVNIYPSALSYLPKNGVYATNTLCCGKKYPSVTNIGINPTVEEGKNIKAETHIFAETDNWYGKEITVEFLEFIRPETHFESMDELKKQVDRDKQKARKYHHLNASLYLTPRLKKIADLIPRGSILADIGTDHAYLPAYCILNGISPSALAMDVNKGPLKSAEHTVNQYGISDLVELRLSDGIEKLNPNEADVIVIAGMGGLLIESILKAHPEVLNEGTILILQPMLAQKELREYLYSSGNGIMNEYLATEGDKVYNIIVAKAGLKVKPAEKDIVLGKNVKENSPECFKQYSEKLARILNKIIDGQSKSQNPHSEIISKAQSELNLIESEA